MVKTSKSDTNPNRKLKDVKLKGAPRGRDRGTINRLNMYRGGKAVRNAAGRIVKAAEFQNRLPPGKVARVEPSQKWFGNTKVIKQSALQKFQVEMKKTLNDPYQMIMKKTTLPISLLNETARYSRVHILDTEPFDMVFGKKQTRKKPKCKVSSFEEYANFAKECDEKYDKEKDGNLKKEEDGSYETAPLWYENVGKSKRIWNELYKVIDSSDVVIQVVDARDPLGTRSSIIENYMKKEKPFKQFVLVMNKVDLIPVWVTQKWKGILSKEFPTIAFHASEKRSFGKGELITLLRQLSQIHKDKKQISVGIIGYPNVGKSSIINTLKNKRVCNVAPVAGETKVWQYITLMRRIYLIDCPGTVPPNKEPPVQMVLKGVVRTEYLDQPFDCIPAILERVKFDYLKKHYKISSWTTPLNFIEVIAKRTGKLLKGGEPDVNTVSKIIINDFCRGKIPYFIPPPTHDSSQFNFIKHKENFETALHIEEDMSDEEKEIEEVGRLKKEKYFTDQNLGGVRLSIKFDKNDSKSVNKT